MTAIKSPKSEMVSGDKLFFVGRKNPSVTKLKTQDAALHRLICLKKMPSSEVMLARGLQLNRFSEKLQTIAEALIDDGHAATTPEGRATINHITDLMSTMNRHAIHTFFAYEQQERMRNQTLENVESVEAQGG